MSGQQTFTAHMMARLLVTFQQMYEMTVNGILIQEIVLEYHDEFIWRQLLESVNDKSTAGTWMLGDNPCFIFGVVSKNVPTYLRTYQRTLASSAKATENVTDLC